MKKVKSIKFTIQPHKGKYTITVNRSDKNSCTAKEFIEENERIIQSLKIILLAPDGGVVNSRPKIQEDIHRFNNTNEEN